MRPSVTVLIAAYNAQDTLSRAIQSALAEPETAEVIVVDDASQDETVAIAAAEAQQDPRVRLICQDKNQGPAAARNRALEVAISDFVAILDSDDEFLPGRLRRLSSETNCEVIADNIAFVAPAHLDAATTQDWSEIAPEFSSLGTVDFVLGNLRRPGVSRGELGFLKPILSREFLVKHNLRYDPALRLGEDYDLYVRMLLAGARMKLTHRPGYAAVVRSNSLSAQHGAQELEQFQKALEAHLRMGPHAPDLTNAMRAHLKDVRQKRDHRVFLNLRRTQGSAAAIQYLLDARDRAWPVIRQIARDKLGLSKMADEAAPEIGARLLLNPDRAVPIPGL
ncbi:glycosyltransferase [Ruegeria sp. SCPT10]|uniref:glycosyltransferase family 2 protein n=1 Tax=Ruegeria sp. SCP10 TaxID=3141377 RepID=UPI00333792DE